MASSPSFTPNPEFGSSSYPQVLEIDQSHPLYGDNGTSLTDFCSSISEGSSDAYFLFQGGGILLVSFVLQFSVYVPISAQGSIQGIPNTATIVHMDYMEDDVGPNSRFCKKPGDSEFEVVPGGVNIILCGEKGYEHIMIRDVGGNDILGPNE